MMSLNKSFHSYIYLNIESKYTKTLSFEQTESAPGPRGRPRLPVSRAPAPQDIKKQSSNSRDPRLLNKHAWPQPAQAPQQQPNVYTSWEGLLYAQNKLVSKIKLEPGNGLLHINALK
jgi:hypothetical protein